MSNLNRNVAGGAKETNLTVRITNIAPGVGATLTLADATGWPTTDFIGKFNAGTVTEEKIRFSTRSGNVLTVAERGFDGTSAADHETTESVTHELDAVAVQYVIDHVNDVRDDHSEYMRADGTRHDLEARHVVGTIVPADAPGSSAPGDAAAEGVSTSAARADHTHGRGDSYGLTAAMTAEAIGSTAVQGTAAGVARIDHRHAMPTAADIRNAVYSVGMIMAWALDTAVPTGWLECDGGSYVTASYPGGATLRTKYGGVDGSHFYTPSVKGKVLVGQDTGQSEFDVVGETGGEKTHQLVTAELAAHVHNVDPPNTSSGNESANHTHAPGDGASYVTTGSGGVGLALSAAGGNPGQTGIESVAHHHDVNIAAFDSASAGSGSAHNNLQPYIVERFIIRVGE